MGKGQTEGGSFVIGLNESEYHYLGRKERHNKQRGTYFKGRKVEESNTLRLLLNGGKHKGAPKRRG